MFPSPTVPTREGGPEWGNSEAFWITRHLRHHTPPQSLYPRATQTTTSSVSSTTMSPNSTACLTAHSSTFTAQAPLADALTLGDLSEEARRTP